MSNLKDITTRVKSIENIRKITKAMELVSISKMRRATEAVLASREYARTLWAAIDILSKKVSKKAHPLLFAQKKMKRALLIVFSSDRGLCGSFNTELFQKVSQLLQVLGEECRAEFVTIGKKGSERAVRQKWNMIASFDNLSVMPDFNDVSAIARVAIEGFLGKKYDRVFLVYTDYISTIKQKSVIHELLPVTSNKSLGDVETNMKKAPISPERSEVAKSSVPTKEGAPKWNFSFKFEPSKDTVLEFILPRAVQVEIYQALLESIASEQAARMVAMKNASDAASDIKDELQLAYNGLRQGAITREIAEISAGKAVLEQV
ncbi:MAG: ATP synthase F1 subunit gamma [bacterium]|nr:ATP synthase F1 subunit gamma [bacterium]